MIKVQSLSKSYGSIQVLKQIDLSFEPGTINGIVGVNGAGKSTLFRCLAQLEPCDGTVQYEGGKLKDVTGFLETSPYFLSYMTGREYLRLFCQARNLSIASLNNKNVFDLPLDRYAASYSTGMKKKLALTAILLQKNEVFILDEPFNGVDLQSNLLILEVMEKLKSLNKIVILSSHIFSTLSTICDHIHHLEEGKIVRSGNKDEFPAIEEAMRKTGLSSRLDALELEG